MYHEYLSPDMLTPFVFWKCCSNARAKLVFGIYLIIMLFIGLTAIEIKHLTVLGNFNTEIFQLMNPLTSVMVGCFSGAEA